MVPSAGPSEHGNFSPVDSNPLFQFRAPRRLAQVHAPVHGDHFITDRRSVVNDKSASSIYPGDFRYRPNRHLELDFKLWEDREDTNSTNDWVRLTNEGFLEALAKDFDVNLRVRRVWRPDTGKRITYGGRSTNTLVLMWRTGAAAQEVEERKMARSDHIHSSVEQQAVKSVAGLSASLGEEMEVIDVSMTEGEAETISLREES